MDFVRGHSITLGANLEQGNLVKPVAREAENIEVEIGFNEESKVFYDYLMESETREKIILCLSDFFNCSREQLRLELSLVKTEDKQRTGFKSVAEIHKENDAKEESELRENIQNDPMLKRAEEMFNSKVDKILITKK